MTKFCSECGSAEIVQRVPEGDQHLRAVCDNCGFIHYVNPKIVAGCLLTWNGKILLAKRAIEPRKGYWTLPAGFMELQESTAEAAARECWEEALARPIDIELMGVTSLPHIGQVYMMYHGTLADGEYGVGEESSDVELFAPEDIPWKQLSFPVVHFTLKRYISGEMSVYDEVIDRQTDWLTKGA